MGFDLHVVMVLMIDQMTGLPLAYNCEVPEKYRIFITQKGPWFSNYVTPFNGAMVSAERFLEEYPEWHKVRPESTPEYIWSQKDHEEFREALGWFAEHNFSLMWTY